MILTVAPAQGVDAAVMQIHHGVSVQEVMDRPVRLDPTAFAHGDVVDHLPDPHDVPTCEWCARGYPRLDAATRQWDEGGKHHLVGDGNGQREFACGVPFNAAWVGGVVTSDILYKKLDVIPDEPHPNASKDAVEYMGPVYRGFLRAIAKQDATAILTSAGTHSPLWQAMMETVAARDAEFLIKIAETYGPSWKQRGGVGAFMMLARKWDRMEIRVKRLAYDIFDAIAKDTRREGVIADVRDLRRYCLLVETELQMRGQCPAEESAHEAAGAQ